MFEVMQKRNTWQQIDGGGSRKNMASELLRHFAFWSAEKGSRQKERFIKILKQIGER